MPPPKERLAKLSEELAALEKESADFTSRWQVEKSQLNSMQKTKEQLEEAHRERDIAQRNGDLARAGELMYGIIPKLHEQLKQAEKLTASALMKEAVTDGDIAAIVSRWTGIPVEKMLEGEREKLLKMEDSLRARVVGQEEALVAVSNAVRRARARFATIRPNPSARSCS